MRYRPIQIKNHHLSHSCSNITAAHLSALRAPTWVFDLIQPKYAHHYFRFSATEITRKFLRVERHPTLAPPRRRVRRNPRHRNGVAIPAPDEPRSGVYRAPAIRVAAFAGRPRFPPGMKVDSQHRREPPDLGPPSDPKRGRSHLAGCPLTRSVLTICTTHGEAISP